VQEHILGIGIAIQGLISPDGKRVVFGKLLHNDHVTLDDFAEHLDYPCILLHDAKTAASCEFWNHPNLKDTAFLLLNKNLGGALFLNGKIHTGPMMTSGIFEHMCLVPNGKPCYCGQRGCLDAYCSAGSLADEAQMSLDEFFVSVRSGSAREVQIWDTYLHNLATAINNILLVVNCDIILGGLLSQYLRPEDLEALHRYAKEKSAFDFPNSYFFSKSKTNAYVEATGAALYYIEDFLKEL
jgi:predicted NBD/HSP70 family sugar kinase